MIYKFSKRVAKISDPTVRDLLKHASKPGMISFGGGIPNADLFPVLKIKKIVNKLLSDNANQLLQYNQTQGYPELLNQLAKYYSNKWRLKLKPENILVTTGSQQALDLFGKAFLDKNDSILVEDPSYFVAFNAFSSYLPKYITVKTEADGIDLINLLQKLGKTSFKFFYLVPTFQNPSGVSLSMAKRKKLVQLTKKENLLVIEDDPYGELYFKKSYPALFSLNQQNIVYTSTFSKTLCPGLRIGYIIAEKKLIEKLTLIKQGMDLHSSTLSQAIAAEFLKDKKALKAHLAKIRKYYFNQKQIMVKALEKYAPPEVSWTNPDGGLFLWLTLPKNVSTEKLYPLALKNNVFFIPGHVFCANKKNYQTLRLTFATVSKEKIKEGIKKLMNLIKNST